MNEKLNDKIKMIALFQDGRIIPKVFLWQKNKYIVSKINLTFDERVGRELVKHFSVSDSSDNVFELAYYPDSSTWKILELDN